MSISYLLYYTEEKVLNRSLYGINSKETNIKEINNQVADVEKSMKRLAWPTLFRGKDGWKTLGGARIFFEAFGLNFYDYELIIEKCSHCYANKTNSIVAACNSFINMRFIKNYVKPFDRKNK